MDWRCEWCGKPHEENDPPCDNCGHGTFEEAVVRQTDLADEGLETTTVWVCTECGRTHTKHSPPCSRCGNHELVMEEQRVDDDELSVPSYFDLVTPRYVLGLVLVLALAGVFVGGITGVIDVPGFGNEVPDVENVPGEADAAGSINLTAVESAYVDAVNDARANANDDDSVSRDDRLDEVATYTNQRVVKSEYGDGSLPSRDRIAELVGDSCEGGAVVETYTLQGGEYATGEELGSAFASDRFADSEISAASTRTVGVDTHTAPDGTVFLTQIVC